MEHFRYRKITPQKLGWIKEMKGWGLTNTKIAKEMGVNVSTIGYHLNEVSREKAIKRAKKYYSKLSKEKLKKIYKKRKNYRYSYYKERYHNDQKFRANQIKNIIKWQKKTEAEYRKKGLCIYCGKEKGEKFFSCASCRIKRRKK